MSVFAVASAIVVGVAAVMAAACCDRAPVKTASAKAVARMSLCIGFSVPVAGGISEDDAGANAASMAGATHAPIDRRGRNKAPGFPKNSAAVLPTGRPRSAFHPIASTAAAAIVVRICDRS
jgi:hypothetical protein